MASVDGAAGIQLTCDMPAHSSRQRVQQRSSITTHKCLHAKLLQERRQDQVALRCIHNIPQRACKQGSSDQWVPASLSRRCSVLRGGAGVHRLWQAAKPIAANLAPCRQQALAAAIAEPRTHPLPTCELVTSVQHD